MRKFLLALTIILAIFFFSGCGKGIEPVQEIQPGYFSGTVTFIGNWPSDIKRTHLVVFQNPILSVGDFFPPNLSFVVDSIPYASKTFTYNSFYNNFISGFQLMPGNYKYVVVAQSKTPTLSLNRTDWFVVGVYTTTGIQADPGNLKIQEGQTTEGINITVDFNNPPPQPPGGE